MPNRIKKNSEFVLIDFPQEFHDVFWRLGLSDEIAEIFTA